MQHAKQRNLFQLMGKDHPIPVSPEMTCFVDTGIPMTMPSHHYTYVIVHHHVRRQMWKRGADLPCHWLQPVCLPLTHCLGDMLLFGLPPPGWTGRLPRPHPIRTDTYGPHQKLWTWPEMDDLAFNLWTWKWTCPSESRNPANRRILLWLKVTQQHCKDCLCCHNEGDSWGTAQRARGRGDRVSFKWDWFRSL